MTDKINTTPEAVAMHMERISGPVIRPQIGSLDHDTFELLYAMSDRIEELEANLAKAVKALDVDNEISFPKDWRERAHSHKGMLKLQSAWVDGFNAARAALAELKGQEDE